MKQAILGLFTLIVFALPQIAGAQEFRTSHQYTAKFLCGEVDPEEGLGVVWGYYNTIVNVLATKDSTAVAYRITPLSTNLEADEGSPSDFSYRYDLDRDEGFSVICSDIKRLVGVNGQTGFIEGFLTIYGQKALIVSDVLTGGGGEGGGPASIHAYDVTERRRGGRISPMAEER
ncbi:MAG: hypothetical protein JRE57_05525 [Deltaproteobacteria bacterium]|nr:hypothetical protein [Deltaproteobacteria bacterium]